MNFVPCVRWVKRGVAKSVPEKVQLTEEELEDIIKHTKNDLEELDDINDEEKDKAEETEKTVADSSDVCIKKEEQEDEDPLAEYELDKYDDEEDKPETLLGIGSLAVYASNKDDPYVTLKDDEDSEEEQDFGIQKTDNLILVGHIEGDASVLEVYVFNEDEGSLYVHHDLLLPSFPLCMEWLNFDPDDPRDGNLVAVGGMSPIIQVWDLDIVDCLEPAFKLGKKASKKKKTPGHGHEDAVLDISWNKHVTHVLASGSVDENVLLWDLSTGKAATTYSMFNSKVQSLKWHPFELQTLLTGSSDSVARVIDCRVDNSFKSWQLNGEVERVLWNHFDPFSFLASTDNGFVQYVDCRMDKPIWQLKAHTKEVTGLTLSSHCPGFLVTASMDQSIKVWDIYEGAPELVIEREFSIGQIQCLEACPDSAFIVCAGGDKKNNNLKVSHLEENFAVRKRFLFRKLLEPFPACEEADDTTMDTDGTANALGAMSLEAHSQLKHTAKHKFKKKKKKKKKKVEGEIEHEGDIPTLL